MARTKLKKTSIRRSAQELAQLAADWHMRNTAWSAELMDWLRQTDPDWVDEVYRLLSQDVPASAGDISGFVDAYLIWHSELEPETPAVVSYIAASDPLHLVKRHPWLKAQMASWLSIWKIEQTWPGQGLLLCDLLTDEERHVWDPRASAQWEPEQVILARVVDVDQGVHFLADAYPQALSIMEALEVGEFFLSSLAPRRRKLRPKDLRASKVFLALTRLWICHLASLDPEAPRASSPPKAQVELLDEEPGFTDEEFGELMRLLELVQNRTLA